MAATIPHFFEIHCDALKNIPTTFVSFEGTEYVSQLFHFELVLQTKRSAIDPRSLIQQPITVRLSQQALPEQTRHWRNIAGIITRCQITTNSEGTLQLRIQIMPKLSQLAYRRDSRIFKDANVPEIVEKVLTAAGFSSGSDFSIQLSGSYRQRPYCMQYDETDLNFIQRLLEEEGIFYYFQHHDNHCTLHLCDTVQSCKHYPTFTAMNFQIAKHAHSAQLVWQIPALATECYHFAWHEESIPAIASIGNYDHPTAMKIHAQAGLKGTTVDKATYYECPFPADGAADHYANVHAEQWESLASAVEGRSYVRVLCPGFLVDLRAHNNPTFNTTYFLTQVHHHCTQSEYWNEFQAVVSNRPYRPQRRTPKPRIHGYLVGRVVGPPGKSEEEIHTNEHGWIRVQFPWSHTGNKADTNSIFIPVAQLWAGKGYGTMFIPRVGMEAVVAFLDGDPDRPIVIGTLYNPAASIPYNQPGKKDVSTILTRSTPKGTAGNELRFTDTKDSEEIYLHAQKDWNTLVEHDRTTTINHDESLTVRNERTVLVENDNKETYHANMDVEVSKDYTLTVKGNLKISVTGDITIEGTNITINARNNLSLKGTAGLVAESPASTEIKGSIVNVKANATLKQEGGAMAELSSGGTTSVRGSIVMIN